MGFALGQPEHLGAKLHSGMQLGYQRSHGWGDTQEVWLELEVHLIRSAPCELGPED